MYVAIDDTDSPGGMCTTFLMTEIIGRIGLDLIGLPQLVRLNPNIPYKTRGNAALCARFGRGTGQSRRIGTIEGKAVLAWSDASESGSTEELAGLVSEIVGEMYERHENTNPGIVVSERRFPGWFYQEALKREMRKEEALSIIREIGASFREFGNGRGLIGASAAMSWHPGRRTFELLAYNHYGNTPDNDEKMKIAKWADSVPGTFSSVDSRHNKALIFPSPRTPVYMGIRSTLEESFINIIEPIGAREETACERYMIYETNQATDDHIQADPEILENLMSCSLIAEISSVPEAVQGGHWFCNAIWNGKTIKAAAFEPSGELRESFRNLATGDMVRFFGSYNSAVLNIEKMEIITLSKEFIRSGGRCRICGGSIESAGKSGVRCRSCGEVREYYSYSERKRNLLPGWYEVPASSRRHLAMPVDLMGIMEQ